MTSYEVTINAREANEVYSNQDTKRIENIRLTNSKQQSYQNATFRIIDINKEFYTGITIGSPVDITIDGGLEFEGFVSAFQKQFKGGVTVNLQCTGNTFELERELTTENESYTAQKSCAIAYQLLETHTDLRTTEIDTSAGVTIASIVFNAESINTCLQRLTELDGFSYYVGSARRS